MGSGILGDGLGVRMVCVIFTHTGLYALCGAGGRGRHFPLAPVVAGGVNVVALLNGRTAVLTHGVAGIALSLAGGILLAVHLDIRMVGGVNRNGLGLHFSASLTLALALHFACFRTGSFLGHVPVVKVMTQRRDFHILHRTGMVQVLAGCAVVFLVSTGKVALARGGAGGSGIHHDAGILIRLAEIRAVDDFNDISILIQIGDRGVRGTSIFQHLLQLRICNRRISPCHDILAVCRFQHKVYIAIDFHIGICPKTSANHTVTIFSACFYGHGARLLFSFDRASANRDG